MNNLSAAEVTEGKVKFAKEVVESIYAAYPKKVAKLKALPAIDKALFLVAKRARSPEQAAAWLLAKVRAYAASRRGEDAQFTPLSATWFNGGRYDDEALSTAKLPPKRCL